MSASRNDEPPLGETLGALERLKDWAVPVADLHRALLPLVPKLMAAVVFAGGIVLMLSGALPEFQSRLRVLRDVLPLPFAEASHLAASLSGLALIVLSVGLSRRVAKARIASTLFLIAGAVFALLKGLDWVEAVLLAAAAALLTANRAAFYRRGDLSALRPTRRQMALILAAVVAVTTVGWIAHTKTELRSDLWWQFAWSGDAPRFMRATLVLAIAVAALALGSLVNRPSVAHPRARLPVPGQIRQLVGESPDCTRHLALLGDKRFLIAPGGDAFLMYGIRGRSWICLGGPSGAPEASDRLIWDFLEKADRAGARPVFAAVSSQRIVQLLDLGHTIAKMGEVARIDLAGFTLEGPQRKDLRYARSRAQRDGLSFGIIPKAEVPAHISALRAVSDAWLGTRKGEERGFALGYFDPAYLAEFDIAVMRQGDRIVAFANLWPSGQSCEMGIDLMRHLPRQSPVLMDAFFAELFLHARDRGFRQFWLGGAPLSGLPEHRLAPLWARIGGLIYRRGGEIYSFGGLRSFKEKFGPDWTPQYLTSPGSLSLPRAFLDVALLCARGPFDDDGTEPLAAEGPVTGG